MEKKLFDFKTKTIVATGLGAALFIVLFMYVKIPTGIPETDIKTAIGHGLSDAIQYGSPWWSWVVASGLTCFITGLVYPKLKVDEGEFKGKDILRFNIYQIIANVISWVIVAPILDIVVYAEPANLVFTQGIVAAISNAISAGVIGTILLALYSKTRSKKGSLSKDQ